METSQRVVKEIADRDNQQISTLLEGMGRLVEILNNSYNVMQDFSKFAAEYKAPNIVTENIIHVSVLEANFSNIRDAANRLKVEHPFHEKEGNSVSQHFCNTKTTTST